MSENRYRSRVIIAEAAGLRMVVGPVHTERGLADLRARLEAAGWLAREDVRLTSVAQFREHPAVWEALARRQEGTS